MIQFIQVWWAHLGSNQGPTGYEPVALPLSYRPKLAYKIILKILSHVKIRIATKRYRSQASTGRVCPFGTGPKSFVSGTFPLHFDIYSSKKFSASTGLRAQTGKVAPHLFVTIRQLSAIEFSASTVPWAKRDISRLRGSAYSTLS